jgi:hypothetical protein
LKPKHDELLSNVAFNFILRRYNQACKALVAHGAITDRENVAGVSALQAVLSETLQHPSMAGAFTRPLLSSTCASFGQ